MILTQDTTARGRVDVIIANGAATSENIFKGDGEITARGFRGLVVVTPAAWTAADIGFEASSDGSAWLPLMDNAGARVRITGVATSAARAYVAPSTAWGAGAFPFVRLVSLNTGTGANENQGAARTLTVVLLR